MPAIISEIVKKSIAEELCFEKGDKILKINGETPKDLIDYRFAINDEYLELEIERKNGEIEVYEIEKDFDEDLGIVFESAVFDRVKLCANNCVFCFVDQQPAGLRESLYVKDDDYRLSYLQGTYITLTNLTKKDKERIERLHLGPLYVSVHTTNPELRAKMLRNKRASEIMESLEWLKRAEIPLHLQIVMCPGLNDGVELKKTLNDLGKFKSVVQSIAVVPVGLTKFHKNNLSLLTEENARKTIDIIDNFNKKIKKHLAQASDEIFLKAKLPIPERKYYGTFAQLEDGVGALRLLMDDFEKNKKHLPKSVKKPLKLTFATSNSAVFPISQLVEALNGVENVECDLVELKNSFFGEDVIVAGLITGKDLINQLKNKKIHTLVIPSIMLRPFSEDFLDGVTVFDVENELKCKVQVIKDIYSVKEIVDLLKK